MNRGKWEETRGVNLIDRSLWLWIYKCNVRNTVKWFSMFISNGYKVLVVSYSMLSLLRTLNALSLLLKFCKSSISIAPLFHLSHSQRIFQYIYLFSYIYDDTHNVPGAYLVELTIKLFSGICSFWYIPLSIDSCFLMLLSACENIFLWFANMLSILSTIILTKTKVTVS